MEKEYSIIHWSVLATQINMPKRAEYTDKRLSEMNAEGLIKLTETIIVTNSTLSLYHWILS